MSPLSRSLQPSAWDCLLENLGEWRGSFAQVAPNGEPIGEMPSITELVAQDDNRVIRQRVRRFDLPADVVMRSPRHWNWEALQQTPTPQDLQLELRSLGRGFAALATGAFSQGSTQLGPFGDFGAELGLIDRPRRVRLVQRFDRHSQLEPLTVIREGLPGHEPDAPQLTPAELLAAILGEWHGTAVTVYPDLRSPQTDSTQLTVTRSGDRITQTLQFADGGAGRSLRSTAVIQGDRLLFTDGPLPIQVLLLPDGISANCPLRVQTRIPFVLELGWLLAPNHRQRLVRRYDAHGEWVSLTLVDEYRGKG